MKYSSVELNDLFDEILIYILKKIIQCPSIVLSLISINKRLHAIIHDPIFTNCLTLMNYVLVDPIDPILVRFSLQILLSIHHKIKWLNLESSCMKRIILLATAYPNLYGLGLYDIEIETALALFIGKIFSFRFFQ